MLCFADAWPSLPPDVEPLFFWALFLPKCFGFRFLEFGAPTLLGFYFFQNILTFASASVEHLAFWGLHFFQDICRASE
jgi:hypothetical protein